MFFLFVLLVLTTTLTITHAASLNTNAYYIHSRDSCKSCTKDMLFFGDTLILLNGGKYMVGIDLDVCESVLLEPQVLMNQNVPSVFETPVDVVFVPQYNAKLINGDASMSFLDDELFAATVENKYDGFVVTCSSSSIVRLDKKYILRICPDGRGLQIPPGLADSIFDYQMVIRHKTATILNKRNIMLIEEPKIYLATESADYTRHLQFKVSALSIIDSEFVSVTTHIIRLLFM